MATKNKNHKRIQICYSCVCFYFSYQTHEFKIQYLATLLEDNNSGGICEFCNTFSTVLRLTKEELLSPRRADKTYY